jgi:polyhydroxybutyrate depolymerase
MRALRSLIATSLAALALAAPAAAAWTNVDAGRGPVPVRYPAGHEPGQTAPLVVLLHGYQATGVIEEIFFGMGPWLEGAGFLYALPDGTVDEADNRFWNATDACCDLFDSGVDDAGYLVALVDTIDAALGVDRHRVFFLGHSNGGFMAYRMACQHAELVAGTVALAAATYDDAADCAPSKELQVLHLHGTEDGSIEYEGGAIQGTPFPGALETVATWAAYAGCAEPPVAGPPFDGHETIPGAETEPLRYGVGAGCGGGSAELWTIVGGEHIPPLTDELRARLRDWLVAAGDFVFADGFETGSTAAWRP